MARTVFERRYLRVAYLIFAAVGGVAVAAGSAAAQQGPLPVDVAAPVSARITDWDEYTGRFEAVERVELRARVTGYLREVGFKDGADVSHGQTLFAIDRRPFVAEVARARGELSAAEATKTLAELQLARAERLLASSAAVSRQEVDDRRAEQLRAEAQVEIAKANLRRAQLDLSFSTIAAPISGRISKSEVDVGNLVVAGETVLATLVKLRPIHLSFTVSEADFLKYARLYRAGARPHSRTTANPVEARLLDEFGWPHKGEMDFVDNEIDPGTGTIEGRAVFTNNDALLTPGLFARLRLLGSGPYDTLLVPDAAVLSDQARKIVLVVDGEGVVSARPVRLGPLHRGLRVVRDGLEASDRVIVAGVQRARPGGAVAPQEVTLELGPETPVSGVR